MKGFIKRVVGGLCVVSILMGSVLPVLATGIEAVSSDGKLIEGSELPLRLHYDEEAPYGREGATSTNETGTDDGWGRWSLPIGNGYFGANVFGRTETERIQITEKTLTNPYYAKTPSGKSTDFGGLNNFSETYLDVGHPFSAVSNYERWLDLNTAISGVAYDYDGVTYTREVFTSYPDKALVIRMDASVSGKLNFVLRPTIPWKQEYAAEEGDGASKDGQVVSYMDGKDGIVELSGKMGYYDIDFLGIYRVVTDGGTVSATACTNEYGETDGTITVSGADSAYIYVVLGSDYELTEEMFTAEDSEKPTFSTDLSYTREKIEAEADTIANRLAGKSYEEAYAALKNAHLEDYCEIFGRVTLDLGNAEDAALTTDALLEKYKAGDYSGYLEALYFQYGRYLLIASSRAGTLPSNLQGTWNQYNVSPWASGMWHNINIQMNYWHAFSTNIAETFEAYVEYNRAYMAKAEDRATAVVSKYNPSVLDEDGGNGWCIKTEAFPYYVNSGTNLTSERSPGNLGFTTQLYWDYYSFTKDEDVLRLAFDVLVNAARFVTKCVELDDEGHYLVSYCDSPEVHVDGIWYYTKGTTYAQTFAYLNNYNALLAAKELGIDLEDTDLLSQEEYSVLSTVMEQLDKYDPIHVGLSGQIKEFREEDYYSSVGDNPIHRHISQLVGLYPGNVINNTTPAWLDAAKVTLNYRGNKAENAGWAVAHRINLWARTGDGESAHDCLEKLIGEHTATNLWDLLKNFFQIDGNFGGTAGISEMLLQSHAGYIALLAAIPEAWDSGSYTGLVARGNFEVAAEWKNGAATCFNITSKSGETASVSYDGITSARVIRLSDGKAVDYTVTGTDLITFETEAGETYIISGFSKVEHLHAPAALRMNRLEDGKTALAWNKVQGAVEYRVYTAIENQPDYTLVGTTTETGAFYIPKSENINARTTFKVVAVNREGVEGLGAIAYQNPVTPNAEINGYVAYAFENGELQVTVKATENTGAYRLWKKSEGASDYTLVAESPYPIIVYDGYTETDSYALTVLSKYLNVESEMFLLSSVQGVSEGSDTNAAKWHTNLLLGKEVVATEGALACVNPNSKWGSYGYDKLTDGKYLKKSDGSSNIHYGRFATKGKIGDCLDGTVSFDTTCILSELRLYTFVNTNTNVHHGTGDEIKIYVCSAGTWSEVYSITGTENIQAALKYDSDEAVYYLPIDLGTVKAEQLRIWVSNNTNTNGITFYEITCSGATLPSERVYNENLLLGKTPVSFSATNSLYDGYDQSKLTDGGFGKNTGRYAQYGKANNGFTVEYDLGRGAVLDTLKVYDFTEDEETVSRVSSASVEVLVDGKWVTFYDAQPLLGKANRLTDDYGDYTPISLGGANAKRIRISMKNTVSNLGVSIYELSLNGYSNSGSGSVKENIFEGKTFTPAEGATIYGSEYGYEKLTDGIYNKDAAGNSNIFIGRYSSKEYVGAFMDGTIELDGVYALGELRLYDYNIPMTETRIGDRLEVYSYYAGEWSMVYSIEGRDEINAAKLTDATYNLTYLPINLDGVKAEAIRVYSVCTGSEKKGITLYEITCSGAKLFELADKNVLSESVSATLNGKEIDTSVLTDGNSDTACGNVQENAQENIFIGKTVIPAEGATIYNNSYSYEKLTDGIYNKDANGKWTQSLGRYSSKEYVGAFMDGTIELGGVYALGELRLYDYAADTRIGDRLEIYSYYAGEWSLVYSIEGRDKINAAKRTDAAYNLTYLPVNLGGVRAEAVRVYSVCTGTAKDGITLYEITCLGERVDTVLEFDLGQNYGLYTLNVRDKRSDTDLINGVLSTRSNDTYVELYSNGEWVRVIDGTALSTTEEFTSFSLYGFSASKLRIGFNNTACFDNGTSPAAIISEMYLTVCGKAPDRKPLLEAYKKLDALAYTDDAYIAKMDEFLGDISEFALSEDDVAERVAEMTAYYEELVEASYTVRVDYVDKNGYEIAPSVTKRLAVDAMYRIVSPAIDGYYTHDMYVTGKADEENKAITVFYYEVPTSADTERIEQYLSNVVAWGDSITAGSGWNNTTYAKEYGIDLEALGSKASGANYVTVLKNLIRSRIYGGIEVDGCGIGGETTASIAARADTQTYYLYLDGAVTVGADAVTVPLAHYASVGRVGILRQGGDAHVNPVTIKGFDADGNEISVVGKLSLALTDDAPEGTDIRLCDAKYLKYTFTRTDGKTDTLSFVAGARVITNASVLYDGRTCIIFMGENGGYSDIDELIRQQEEMLAACGDPEFFLIISTTSGSNESRKEIREALSTRWGEHYINMGDELNSSEASYQLAGYSKEAIDSVRANIEAGTVTKLLLTDGCHPNAVGHAVVGNVIFERLYDIGAFDAVLDYYDCLNGVIEHSYSIEKNDARHWKVCTVCGAVDEASVKEHVFSDASDTVCDCGYEREIPFKITGASLTITNDISVDYSATVPVGYADPYMVFEFNGETYKVTEYDTKDGELIFSFPGVVPQMMGDNIKATLFATRDGETVSVERAEYSVLTYCKNMLKKTTDEKLRTLLSDLLVYGATSQVYMDYKTDALVTEGLALTPSTFASLSESDKTIVGEADPSVIWKGAALRYENAMAMKFSFAASADYTVKIAINGRETTYKVSNLTKEGDDYVVYFRGILATEYGSVVSASIYDGDVQIGQSVTYSVNSYVYAKQDDLDTKLAELVQATYNYGKSAENYVR